MVMAVWQRTITDAAGNVIPSASVEVLYESSGGLAAIFTDRAGATPASNPITADSDGFVRFYAAGGSYRIRAYSGATERIWRYVPIGLLAEDDDLYPDRTAAESAASVTPTNYAYPPGHVYRYGTNTTPGTTNMTTAFQAAVDVSEAGGGPVILPKAIIGLTTGVVIDADGVEIIGESRRGTIIRALAGSITLLRIAASYCSLKSLKFEGNGQTSVTAIRLADTDETQTSTVTYHNYNTLRDLWISGVAEGIILKPGPDVAAVDSQLFYNSFENIHIYQCTRGIWFRAGTNAGSSGPNRNFFRGIRIGESGCNTGMQLDAGDTNMFSQVSFEGVASGTSPNATPCGLRIAATDANGNSLLYNTFSQCFWEGCTADLVNANVYSEFFQCFPAAAKTTWTAVPHFFLGGYLAGAGPLQAMHGYVFQSNAEIAGYPDDIAFFPGGAGVPASSGLRLGAGGPIILAGTGTPEGAVTAPVGSLFTRSDGGAGTSLYVKQSGSGNTGWTAVTP